MLKKNKNILKNVLTNNGEIDIIKSTKENRKRNDKGEVEKVQSKGTNQKYKRVQFERYK